MPGCVRAFRCGADSSIRFDRALRRGWVAFLFAFKPEISVDQIKTAAFIPARALAWVRSHLEKHHGIVMARCNWKTR